MKKWKVLRDNYGYLGRYYTKGEIISLDDDATPPHHLQLLDEWERAQTSEDIRRSDPMRPVPYQPGKYPLLKKTGFAAKVVGSMEPQVPETAGKHLKHRK